MKLSICMMVKNESKYLEQCLQAMQPLRDAVSSELIIVDTGSEDNTVEIAKNYTDKVYFHEWNDSFSEMRNITIGHATGEWVFIIDGDEVLENTQGLIEILQAKKIPKDIGVFALTSKNLTNLDDLTQYSEMITPRLFRNDGYFHYEGAIHNQPVFHGKAVAVNASQVHYGYLAGDKEMMERKFQRTSRLLKKELDKDPEHLYYRYQLSVSYAMHGDTIEALQTIEKGYEIFCKKGKPLDCMFIMTHLVQMYQNARMYDKVEKFALEAISLKDNYIDVYYFLAEAEAMQQKFEESVRHYEKYFWLIAHRDEQGERDPSVMDYTLGNQDVARFNLAQAYRIKERYEDALRVIEQIQNEKARKDIFETTTYSYLYLKRYPELRRYYDEQVSEENRNEFFAQIEHNRSLFSDEVYFEVAEVFADLPGEYGLLQCMRKEIREGRWSEATVERFRHLDFSTLPTYCSDILYYLIREKYPLQTIQVPFKETWFPPLFTAIEQSHRDFSDYLYSYITSYQPEKKLAEYKFSKMLCRILLLMDQLSDEQYREIFGRYIMDGSAYLTFVYQPEILSNGLAYELKNDEEVFVLYLYLAEQVQGKHDDQYVAYLHQALDVFPALKKGIQFKLYELKEVVDQKRQAEQQQLEEYKEQVKQAIRQLAENHQMDEAKKMIEEYKSLVPDDLDILIIESNLLLYEMKQNSVVQ